LGDLSVATPRNLWLIEFTESGGGARFTGIALDNETVALFMRQLAASPYFFNVDLDESVQVRPTGPAGETALLTRFVVKATVDFFGRGGKPAGDGADKPAGGKPQRGT
jgi:Tfp pilus assembly protein PilN